MSETQELIEARSLIGDGALFPAMRDWLQELPEASYKRRILPSYITGHYGLPEARVFQKELREFGELQGQVITKIENCREDTSDWRGPEDEIRITLDTGEVYRLYHYSDCCESVTVEDICGDLDDLLNLEIMLAEEVTNSDTHPEGLDDGRGSESFTWTFYKLVTHKGAVTIRWFGESNGYYSEEVEFGKVGRSRWD